MVEVNAPRGALEHLPRPVFLSYARRDFRIAYYVWQQMLTPGDLGDHNEQVLLDVPPLVPPDMRLLGMQVNVSTAGHPFGLGVGYADDWIPGLPGWMKAIGENIIRAKSLAVVLTPHSAASKAVALETEFFERFPEKPVAIFSVNRTPIPDSLARIERAMVHDVTVNARSVMGNVLHAAYEAQDAEKWWEAGVLFLEAWNLLALLKDRSQELCLELLRGRGRADMNLGYRDEAVRSFERSLDLIQPDQAAVRAEVLHNLGWAHATVDREEIGRARESIELAKRSWEGAIQALESSGDSEEVSPALGTLRDSCQTGLEWADRLLQVDPAPLIADVIPSAGQAEAEGDWEAMANHYETMFGLYRAGGRWESGIAADMLSGKARAERRSEDWESARKTLKFALRFVDEGDTPSRMGLMHDLACVYARRAPDAPIEEVEWNDLLVAGRLWSDALELAMSGTARTTPKARFNVSTLARSCESYIAWARGELQRRKGDEESASEREASS